MLLGYRWFITCSPLYVGAQFNFSTSGSNTAGGTYTVTCVVTAESSPTAIEWMDSQGGTIVSGDGITLGDVTIEDNTTSFSLQFSPLRTSHGGKYTCQATVDFENTSGSVDVNVQGELTVKLLIHVEVGVLQIE